MIFVDTGYLLALYNPPDPHHAAAMAWSNRVGEPLVLTDYVLLETVNAMSRRRSRPLALAVVDLVGRDPQFAVVAASDDLLAAGLALFGDRSDKDWSLTDCISFHVMADRGIRSALAYDHHFEQAGFEPLLRREP